jgi:NitT/TauT family transport system substrate-binding protein
MMVGGIDKQIYLPYQLAQSLGFYKKYGVNMVLSTEQSGGVGAEDAMASGQVNMAGAWYVHTINFQLKGKAVEDIAQLSGSPGERIMCATGTHITSPTQWKGQSIGVTDLGSGTDQLTQYLAARYGLKHGTDYNTIAAGAGTTMIAALQHHRVLCGMTTQPTVAAIETLGAGYPAFDLTTTAGVQKWLGGFVPTAGVLAQTSWVNAN